MYTHKREKHDARSRNYDVLHMFLRFRIGISRPRIVFSIERDHENARTGCGVAKSEGRQGKTKMVLTEHRTFVTITSPEHTLINH